MATIRRRGTTWQVQVRRQGHATLSRTFRLKADAEQWARQKEAEIDRGELPVDTRVLQPTTQSQTEWWSVLEVTPSASKDEIVRNYRRKIQQCHPDRVAGLAPEFLRLGKKPQRH
jgi:DnaJ-domain-containing protein 1